jgi:predicted DNA-binding transcriptional regulator AlpA
MSESGECYLNVARVCNKFSRKKSWLYELVKDDPTFPKPLRLGVSQVWIESQLDQWMLMQSAAYKPPQPRKPGRPLKLVTPQP